MKAIFRSELIWVNFPAGATAGVELPFEDQPLLNGNYIMGIESCDETTLAFTPDNQAVAAALSIYSLTLNQGSDQMHRHFPVAALNPLAAGGVWKEFVPFITDWQKCRVRYLSSVALEAAESVPFIIHYFRPEDIAGYKAMCMKLGMEP